jgi:hypothetical protein
MMTAAILTAIAGLAVICIAPIAHLLSPWLAPKSSADEIEPAPETDAERRARNAEGQP